MDRGGGRARALEGANNGIFMINTDADTDADADADTDMDDVTIKLTIR